MLQKELSAFRYGFIQFLDMGKQHYDLHNSLMDADIYTRIESILKFYASC